MSALGCGRKKAQAYKNQQRAYLSREVPGLRLGTVSIRRAVVESKLLNISKQQKKTFQKLNQIRQIHVDKVRYFIP
jgi:hypothetical protein